MTGLRPGEKLFEELRYDKEMVDSTAHEGIFVTRMEDVDPDTFKSQLETLKKIAESEDAEKTENVIFDIVPSASRETAKAERKKQLEELKAAEEEKTEKEVVGSAAAPQPSISATEGARA